MMNRSVHVQELVLSVKCVRGQGITTFPVRYLCGTSYTTRGETETVYRIVQMEVKGTFSDTASVSFTHHGRDIICGMRNAHDDFTQTAMGFNTSYKWMDRVPDYEMKELLTANTFSMLSQSGSYLWLLSKVREEYEELMSSHAVYAALSQENLVGGYGVHEVTGYANMCEIKQNMYLTQDKSAVYIDMLSMEKGGSSIMWYMCEFAARVKQGKPNKPDLDWEIATNVYHCSLKAMGDKNLVCTVPSINRRFMKVATVAVRLLMEMLAPMEQLANTLLINPSGDVSVGVNLNDESNATGFCVIKVATEQLSLKAPLFHLTSSELVFQPPPLAIKKVNNDGHWSSHTLACMIPRSTVVETSAERLAQILYREDPSAIVVSNPVISNTSGNHHFNAGGGVAAGQYMMNIGGVPSSISVPLSGAVTSNMHMPTWNIH